MSKDAKTTQLLNFAWHEKNKSAACKIHLGRSQYSLYVGELPDVRATAWYIRRGKRLIASGVANRMGEALAQVENAFENWAFKVWRVYSS